ncbi:MAG: M42 family metallopeptidase [Anaerolineales bacterium]|nr:M42 family metallopeptidase [Anaerolineales bacterium]
MPRPIAQKTGTQSKPPASSPDLDFVARLSNAVAVSGDESAVRKLILDVIRPHVDEMKVDALGNVLAVKRSRSRNAQRMLVAAHMDEIGFMVTGHDSDGSLKFDVVGGVDERILPGKPVLVRAESGLLRGVIGVAPIHLLNSEQRNSVVKVKALRIDLGVENAEAAKKLVKAGDRGTFATEFRTLGEGAEQSLCGKALDNRLGCATLVELLQNGPYPCELHAAFTVQEEVGLRGARVIGYAVNPAAAFVLDCTPARDLPPSLEERENIHYNTRLGLGPAIYVADPSTLHDRRLIRYLEATAQKAGLPYQIRQPGGGSTDAGAIHLARAGIPSVSVSVPARYLHTPAALARLADWRNTVALIQAALAGWSAKVLA